MCGICGKVYFEIDRPVEKDILTAMCQSIRHRGPDGQGQYRKGAVGLGSVRLSIIDLEGGHMPLANEDQSIWIVYNGEVYNFPELRQRLQAAGHQFATRSDTEVLVHLYEEKGETFARELNGMFAFAIWDERRQKLLLGRDQLGIKPLFYAELPDRLLFGSEIKAILQDGIARELDRIALHDYLSLNYVPGPRTLFKNIRKLPPGHILTLNVPSGRPEIKPFWQYPAEAEANGRNGVPENPETALLDVLRQSVHDTMISDVPVGAFLSGGIDSSLVVALMSEVTDQPVQTFSVGFEERSYSELPYAKIIAERYRTDHHELVLQPDVRDLIFAMVDYFDEPFADNSAVAVYAVSRLAAADVKVVLSGDGGDELFGGYYTYQADKLAKIYRQLPAILGERLIPGLVQTLPTSFDKASLDFKLKRFVSGASQSPLAAHYAWKAYLSEDMKAELYAKNGQSAPIRPTVEVLQAHYDAYPARDWLNRLLHVDCKVQLVDDMLTKVDRMSMAHSLEVRVPLLDQRLLQFAARLPARYKVRGLKLKHILKQVAKQVLPEEIINRPKAGFTIPIARWLAQDLRELVDEALSPQRLQAQGIFAPQKVQAMLEAHRQGKRDYSRSLFTLLVFSLWHQKHL